MNDLIVGYSEASMDLSDIKISGSPIFQAGQFEYMMLERPDAICFDHFNPDKDFNLWEKGRLFCHDSELKWKKRRNGFHVVAMSIKELPTGFNAIKFDEIKSWQTRSIFLWGVLEQPENTFYYEPLIPQRITYPAHSSRIVITVDEYIVTEGENISTIHRYKSVEGC
jgi:hypothetical protein